MRFISRFSSTVSVKTKANSAADVLYRNPEAISSRLSLLHLYRLKVQPELDRQRLVEMQRDHDLDASKTYIRVSCSFLDNPPGVESQFVPDAGKVSFSFSPDKLGLTADQKEIFLKLVGDRYDVDSGYVRFEVAHFPFKELNEKLGFDIIRDLLSYIKNESSDKFTDVPLRLPKSRQRPDLKFPEAWLPANSNKL